MKKSIILSSILLGLIFILPSCKNDPPDGIDSEMYELGRSDNGFTWYKNSSAQLTSNSDFSGHSESKQRTRFNSVAATMLDADFKVMEGITFPEGSLIVKELYNNSGNLRTYAMLYKRPDLPEADDAGWVWGYFNEKGGIRAPASEQGSQCRGCHNQQGSIDYTLINISHP